MFEGSQAVLNVTLRQLQVFVVAAEAGSFGGTGEQLDIAQSSVSAHVLALEDQLGQAVFLRRPGRRPVLTPYGTMLLDRARRILAEVHALMDAHPAAGPLAREPIVFACQRSLAHEVLPQVLAGFAQRHPGVELITRVGTQEDVIGQMEAGQATLGCFLSNTEATGLGSRILGQERYVLIAAHSHRLSGRRVVSARDISKCDFVGPPENSMFGRNVVRILQDAGVERVTVVSRATEYQMLRQLVIAGMGVACSAWISARRDLASGELSMLPFTHPKLAIGVRLIVQPGIASTALRALIGELERCWAERPQSFDAGAEAR